MYPNWSKNDILVDGVKIHYTRTGDGSKPPVVLAHGFSDSGMCWLPLARDLETDYDVFLPDARGHGLSARVHPGEAIDLAADTAGLIRELGLDRPVLGGHSMGASTSAEVEFRFSGLVRALVLEDPPWFMPRPPEPEKEGQPRPNPMEWILKIKDLSLDELVAQCHKDSPTWQEAELRPWAESKKQFDYNFLQRPGNRNPFEHWQEISRAIRCPTLLITADNSKGAIVNSEAAQLVANTNSNIQVVNISGAGHNIRRENYPAYLKAVRAFLKEQFR